MKDILWPLMGVRAVAYTLGPLLPDRHRRVDPWLRHGRTPHTHIRNVESHQLGAGVRRRTDLPVRTSPAQPSPAQPSLA